MSLMSYAGKLALMNSLVTSLAIYPMGTLRLPPKIIEQMDKIRRHGLWIRKTDDGDKCNSLAAWDMVCRPKKNVVSVYLTSRFRMTQCFLNYSTNSIINLIRLGYTSCGTPTTPPLSPMLQHLVVPSGGGSSSNLCQFTGGFRR